MEEEQIKKRGNPSLNDKFKEEINNDKANRYYNGELFPTADSPFIDYGQPDRELITKIRKATYTCPFCKKSCKGIANYYSHVLWKHKPSGPLKKKTIRRPPLASELLDAMNRAMAGVQRAANELGSSKVYFLKWAKILIPEEFALYKKRRLIGIVRKGVFDVTKRGWYKQAVRVLAGTEASPIRWHTRPQKKLHDLFSWGLLPKCCSLCGFSEQRVTDNKMPMLVDFNDGDQKNWKQDNLRILCYNCYFLNYRDLMGITKDKWLKGH